MWIDQKRRQEIEERQGLSKRTIMVITILFASVTAAYFFTGWLFSSGLLTLDFFHNELKIPGTIGQETIRFGLVILIVLGLQFIGIMGFALAIPENRQRSGEPTAVTKHPDFYDSQYGNY